MGELLLEIGTEEIPSDYLDNGIRSLKRLAESRIRESRIKVEGGLDAHGTPRRLVLIGSEIAENQDDAVQEMTGPPKKVAFDEDGNPTKAAIGFAQKQGVSVDALEILNTPKGEYLYVKRLVAGRPTIEILSEIFPYVIANIPWPKSMRWGSGEFSFVRPIHWILALFNGKVVPFEVAGVKSGDQTRGHRFMAPDIITVRDLGDYETKMRAGSVIIDEQERMKEVEKAVITSAHTVSGLAEKDLELLSTVTNMVEIPFATCGDFDDTYLNLPEPVLITAMKEHQRYFSIRDNQGRLMPNFIAINNTVPKDEAVVKRGHERVLRARLSDADFFFTEDRKRSLEERVEDLEEVIYQADLGTSYAKVQRFTQLAEFLAEQIAPEKVDDIRLAARLCKCDLVTEMVMEFPSLQGTIGEIYARLDGHPEEICRAISDHYLPVQADSPLPESLIGSIVGMADRMDTIVGCFAVGLEPTGTADPYALRRHAIGIIRIIRDKKVPVAIWDFVEKSSSILAQTISFDAATVESKVKNFIKDRFKNLLLSSGITQDFIEAVLTVDLSYLDQIEERIGALRGFRESSMDFEGLVTAFKRIMNITKGFEETGTVNPGLFEHKSEGELWNMVQKLEERARGLIEKHDYRGALNLLAGLREPIDTFFTQVMIMAEDMAVRKNRLTMLKQINKLFLHIADLSKFAV
ncbi:MAG: glycine--tRNA ligase subunit beta [Deltaproteobacteria bacterium]|nr:glycine--tRNA ligase subunit beta [Deltaproteobacteria bacterium]